MVRNKGYKTHTGLVT